MSMQQCSPSLIPLCMGQNLSCWMVINFQHIVCSWTSMELTKSHVHIAHRAR
ncbi:hypothetical protein DAI22_07g092100 [Oryza sativa Japonica Group]|nr:hypothetical protein DAI22_07g092100 [Oryza sativa Japonica Group]